MPADKPVLVTNKVCPFAHRAWLTMEELGIEYEIKETSIKAGDKPAWFTELYQRSLGANEGSDGKVPVLVHDGLELVESAVVAEYAAETFRASSGVDLLPSTPLERAEISIFVSQVVDKYTKAFYGLLMNPDQEAWAKGRENLLSACATLSAAYSKHGGPYFLGSRLSLADIIVWPFLVRLCVVEHYRAFALPVDDPKYAALNAFINAMKDRKAVQATTMPDSFFIDGYKGYANPAPKQ